MIERDIRDLLIAINMKQKPLDMNTSLIINYRFDEKCMNMRAYYSVTVWENNHPKTDVYYSRLNLLAALSLILDDLTK